MGIFDWFKSADKDTYICDGCGQDYPSSHLEYIDLFDGHFCPSCATMEGDK